MTIMLLVTVGLASTLPVVGACGHNFCRQRTKVDFVLHIENVVRVDDNVHWWYNNGDYGIGTPPEPAPEGATKRVDRGYQFVLQGEGTYIQIGETQIPLAPEQYTCVYDVYVNYEADLPVICELKYFTRERISFNTKW